VKVANPNLNSSRAILAGYLSFENYTSLKQFFQADPFIDGFCKERYVSFRIPGVKHDFLWQVKRIFGSVLGLMNKPDLLNRSFPTPLAAGEEGAPPATSHNFGYTA
jgi:hypothetical protein